MEAEQKFHDISWEQIQLPLISINLNGEVVAWTKGAENLLGYTKNDAISLQKNFIIKDKKEFSLILEKVSAREMYIYKTQQEHKKGYPINLLVNISPTFNSIGNPVGMVAFVQSTSVIKKASQINSTENQRDTKRTFKVIRNSILWCLVKGKMTINQVSNNTGINWRTVEKHLTHLIGKKMVEEVFSSEYVRIFELTEKGRLYIKSLQKEKLTDYFKIEEVKQEKHET